MARSWMPACACVVRPIVARRFTALCTVMVVSLQPFFVTIDERAHDYLPHIFGSNAYTLIKNPAELPHKLPLFYAQHPLVKG